jgi:acyl-CoA synthetase (AMP-forming)/AMP-acid ligase II
MLPIDAKIISVDDHVIEHPRVWLDRLPAKYSDVAPRIDGWLATRDQGWIDADGYLPVIEGRSDDTIIRGGENLAPAEIEDVLLNHPAVAEAAAPPRPPTAIPSFTSTPSTTPAFPPSKINLLRPAGRRAATA